jgi:hypothetical protein
MKAAGVERTRRLIDYSEAKHGEADDAAAARAEYFERPMVVAALERVRAIEAEIAMDATRDMSELVRVRQAIQVWETPEHDSMAGRAMLRQVTSVEEAREQARVAVLEQTLATAKATYDAAKAAMAPARIRIEGDTTEMRLHDLYMKMEPQHPAHDAAFEALQQVRQGNAAAGEAILEQYAEA